jgi:hypothetical protein
VTNTIIAFLANNFDSVTTSPSKSTFQSYETFGNDIFGILDKSVTRAQIKKTHNILPFCRTGCIKTWQSAQKASVVTFRHTFLTISVNGVNTSETDAKKAMKYLIRVIPNRHLFDANLNSQDVLGTMQAYFM